MTSVDRLMVNVADPTITSFPGLAGKHHRVQCAQVMRKLVSATCTAFLPKFLVKFLCCAIPVFFQLKKTSPLFQWKFHKLYYVIYM